MTDPIENAGTEIQCDREQAFGDRHGGIGQLAADPVATRSGVKDRKAHVIAGIGRRTRIIEQALIGNGRSLRRKIHGRRQKACRPSQVEKDFAIHADTMPLKRPHFKCETTEKTGGAI